MENVNSWAVSIIVCSVLVCITELFSDGGNLHKTVRFVIGAFILSALIFPLKDTLFDDSLNIGDNVYDSINYTDDISEMRKKMLKNEVAELIERTLKENDIGTSSVDVSLVTDNDYTINDISADVVLGSGYKSKASKAQELITSKLGLRSTVS